jgi:hypothetical protein
MHGFCHIEIPATNATKSSQFYASLFGWPMMKMDGMEYYLFGTPNDGNVYGAITEVKAIANQECQNYVEVADINASLKKAESLGARIARPRTEISGGHGFFGIIDDPSGYQIGIWSKN